MEAWKRGAEVFKNCGCTGEVDLVLSKGVQDLISVDVGTAQMNGDGHYGASGGFSRKTATPIVVHPVTKEIRWVRGKEPKGWEDFWN